MEILDLTISPPVLRRLQSNTPISITPVSELRTVKPIYGGGQDKCPNSVVSTDTPSSSCLLPETGNPKLITSLKTYQAPSGRMKQTKLFDFWTPSRSLCNSLKATKLSLDLHENISSGGFLFEAHHQSSLSNSIAVNDFGNPSCLSDLDLDLCLRTCNLVSHKESQRESSILGFEAIDCGDTCPPVADRYVPIVRSADYCSPSSVHQINSDTPSNSDCNGSRSLLAEIRDILRDIKQRVTSIEGHMKETLLPAAEGHQPAWGQGVSSQLETDKQNYHGLSPGTRDKIEKLSLEELLLCVGPQSEVSGKSEQFNPIPAACPPPLCTAVGSSKQKPNSVPPMISPKPTKESTLVKTDLQQHSKRKGKASHQAHKQTRKPTTKAGKRTGGRKMNFKPLFKLLETLGSSTDAISNCKNVDSKASKSTACQNTTLLDVSSIPSSKQSTKIDLRVGSNSIQGQGVCNDIISNDSERLYESPQIPQSPISSGGPSGNRIPVIIGNRYFNKRRPTRGNRWRNHPSRQNYSQSHRNLASVFPYDHHRV